MPVGLLGVLPLRGVFVEAGVFGLKGSRSQFTSKKMMLVDKTMFDTYIGLIII